MIANLLGPRLAAIVVKELWAVLRDQRGGETARAVTLRAR